MENCHMTTLYDVFLTQNPTKKLLPLRKRWCQIACVKAVGNPEAPDFAAIRAALPHYYRRAYDRAIWSRHSRPIGEPGDYWTITLCGSRGKLLGSILANAI